MKYLLSYICQTQGGKDFSFGCAEIKRYTPITCLDEVNEELVKVAEKKGYNNVDITIISFQRFEKADPMA